jgi:hypothetical protein
VLIGPDRAGAREHVRGTAGKRGIRTRAPRSPTTTVPPSTAMAPPNSLDVIAGSLGSNFCCSAHTAPVRAKT